MDIYELTAYNDCKLIKMHLTLKKMQYITMLGYWHQRADERHDNPPSR